MGIIECPKLLWIATKDIRYILGDKRYPLISWIMTPIQFKEEKRGRNWGRKDRTKLGKALILVHSPLLL
jgi:hypothetical protein